VRGGKGLALFTMRKKGRKGKGGGGAGGVELTSLSPVGGHRIFFLVYPIEKKRGEKEAKTLEKGVIYIRDLMSRKRGWKKRGCLIFGGGRGRRL